MTEPTPQAAAMTPKHLFEMVSDEVFRDGVVDETENKLLNVLASFLKLPTDEARQILATSKNRFEAGELGEQAPLDPQGLYCRTVSRVYADGVLDDAEDQMLRGLRKLFRISDSAHARLIEGFKNAPESAPAVESIPPTASGGRQTFEDLLARHVAMGIDKQIAFQERIGAQTAVTPDFEAGTITFGEQTFRMQLLGTVTSPAGPEGKRVWNWSWAEDELAGKGLLDAGFSLKDQGLDEDIYVLSEPRVNLDTVDPTHIALVASGLTGSVAYYGAPGEKGHLFLLVIDDDFHHAVPDPVARIQFIFPQVAARYEGDHQIAFRHYLEAYGLNTGTRTETYGHVNGRGVTAMFDESGRMVRPPMAY